MMNQDKDKLISVIVPVYNISGYISKCIDSIIGQTYKNLEIILVDDGSTDESGRICEEYRKKDSRIKVSHKRNGGLSDARNHGIDIAEGEYLGFVDGDDWIHPQMYEIMLDKMLQYDASMVTCGFERENQDFVSHIYEGRDIVPDIIDRDKAISDLYITYVMAFNKLYKREIFEDLRYPYRKLHEDEYVIHRILYSCNKIAVIKEKLYFYYYREGSIVSKVSRKRIDDSLDALSKRISFVKENDWEAALAPVINQYCEYCVNWYFELLRREDSCEYSEEIDLLYTSEQKMISVYSNLNINKDYRIFAENPNKYKKIIRQREKVINAKVKIKAALLGGQ